MLVCEMLRLQGVFSGGSINAMAVPRRTSRTRDRDRTGLAGLLVAVRFTVTHRDSCLHPHLVQRRLASTSPSLFAAEARNPE